LRCHQSVNSETVYQSNLLDEILHHQQRLCERSGHWFTRMLILEQKVDMIDSSWITSRWKLFLIRIVTQDETLVPHPETKSKSMEATSHPPPYKNSVMKPFGLYDHHSTLLINYLIFGRKITGAYYCHFLWEIEWNNNKEQRRKQYIQIWIDSNNLLNPSKSNLMYLSSSYEKLNETIIKNSEESNIFKSGLIQITF
jgi:hypothetical protein